MGADTPRDGFPRRKRLIALTQPARNVRAKCSMKLELWRTDRDICRTLACSECAPSHCDYRNGKVQRLRLNHHGLSWASRPQEVIFGESNIGGPSGRKRAGVGSVVADINDSAGCGETGSWAGLRQKTRCPPWVSTGRTQSEHIEFASPRMSGH